MDVQAAGPGLVAGVAQGGSSAENVCPGHFVEMVVQGHGVGHQLQTVVQGAVILDVEVLQAVGDGQQFSGIIRVFPRAIDLQLHTKPAGAIAAEQGLGFKVVVPDCLVAALSHVTVVTARLVIVAGTVVGVILVDDPSAAGTGEIPVVAAGLAQGRCVVSRVFVPPDAGAAVGADHRGTDQTVQAELMAVKFGQPPSLKGVPAGIAAVIGFVHIVSPENQNHRLNRWF